MHFGTLSKAAIRFYKPGQKWQLSRVISAPNVRAFEKVHWSEDGMFVSASCGRKLWFWDMSRRTDYEPIQDLENDPDEANLDVQRELEFYQNAQNNCATEFDAQISAMKIQQSSVFVTLVTSSLHEVFYDAKRHKFTTVKVRDWKQYRYTVPCHLSFQPLMFPGFGKIWKHKGHSFR